VYCPFTLKVGVNPAERARAKYISDRLPLDGEKASVQTK